MNSVLKYTSMNTPRTFTKVIGACCRAGQPLQGTESAPHEVYKMLRRPGSMEMIDSFDLLGNGYRDLYKKHNAYLHQKNKVITVGGDHSISLSTVASSGEKYKDDLVVVWVDAHPDINTRESSYTKNIHGMPVASFLGIDNLFNLPTINPSQLIYIGIRDIDEYEQTLLDTHNIEHYNMKYIQKYGIKDIINNISKIDVPIHLSLDVDAVDPTEFISTGTPVPFGLRKNDVWDIVTKLKKNLVSTDIVELNTNLSTNYTIKKNDITFVTNIVRYLM